MIKSTVMVCILAASSLASAPGAPAASQPAITPEDLAAFMPFEKGMKMTYRIYIYHDYLSRKYTLACMASAANGSDRMGLFSIEEEEGDWRPVPPMVDRLNKPEREAPRTIHRPRGQRLAIVQAGLNIWFVLLPPAMPRLNERGEWVSSGNDGQRRADTLLSGLAAALRDANDIYSAGGYLHIVGYLRAVQGGHNQPLGPPEGIFLTLQANDFDIDPFADPMGLPGWRRSGKAELQKDVGLVQLQTGQSGEGGIMRLCLERRESAEAMAKIDVSTSGRFSQGPWEYTLTVADGNKSGSLRWPGNTEPQPFGVFNTQAAVTPWGVMLREALRSSGWLPASEYFKDENYSPIVAYPPGMGMPPVPAPPGSQPAITSCALSPYMPFDANTSFTYSITNIGREVKERQCCLACIGSAEAGAERLGLFSVEEDTSSSKPAKEAAPPAGQRLAIVQTGTTFWFVLAPPHEPSASQAAALVDEQARLLLEKLAPALRDAEDPVDVSEDIAICGYLRALPAEGPRGDVRPGGMFLTIGAFCFEQNPFIPLKRPLPARYARPPGPPSHPIPRPEWRGGWAILQKGVGILEMSTWDRTVLGHSMRMELVDYNAGRPNWPAALDLSANGRHKLDGWEFDAIVSEGIGELRWPGTNTPHRVGTGRGVESTRIVTPWGMFIWNDQRSWWPERK